MRHIEVSENQDNPRNVKLPKLITINFLNHKISFGHLINHTSFHKIWKVKSFAQLFWESSGNRYILYFERFAFLHFELFAGSFLAFCLDCIRVLAAANGFEKPREVLITSRFSQLKSYQQVWALNEQPRDTSITSRFSWFRWFQQIFIVLCDFVFNCLYSLSEQANCLHIVELFAHFSYYFENIFGWKWPIVHPGTVCDSLQLENFKNHLRFSLNHVLLSHTLFLLIANSPSFWCGLHSTHQNYARHPRQLVRSCLQLGTLEVIVSRNGWADCLGSRKSAQLCLAPSRPPPVIFLEGIFNFISLKSFLIQIPPLLYQKEI